jgi:hypothetical protein
MWVLCREEKPSKPIKEVLSRKGDPRGPANQDTKAIHLS